MNKEIIHKEIRKRAASDRNETESKRIRYNNSHKSHNDSQNIDHGLFEKLKNVLKKQQGKNEIKNIESDPLEKAK